MPEAYFKHESAYVDEPCTIGEGTKVWHFCHLMKNCRIGRQCNFGQNVFVASDVVVGDRVKIQNNVSLYTGTTVEDEVFIGPSAVLTNVTNPRSQVNRHTLYEPTRLRRGCSIGANATIVCGVTIGRYAFVGAGAVVAADVPDYALMLGVPAKRAGWMSRHGHRLTFGESGIATCPESGYRYELTGAGKSQAVRCLDLDEEAPLPPDKAEGHRTYDELKQPRAGADHQGTKR
jgi:UDP-2-acetamido-3-amino-2,3-dideoxy-glucuronate N-acetyltransferase